MSLPGFPMQHQPSQYAYIWEYLVQPDRIDDFRHAYGPNGTWVKLFRRAGGYLRTELHQDRSEALRFVTIDYWRSASDWESFRKKFAVEFVRLDAECESMTKSEIEIGRFEPVQD